MYYFLSIIATVLFGFGFLFNKKFQEGYGKGLQAAILFSAGTSAIGFLTMFAINRFQFEFTVFSSLLALALAVNNFLYVYCSIKVLSCANLSVYSMFAMLGGMLLPVALGMVYYHEAITVRKCICCFFIILSVLLNIQKGTAQKYANLYYAAVFILNGMAGVLSKVHQSYPEGSVSSNGFSVLSNLFVLLLSVLFSFLFFVIKKKKLEIPNRSAIFSISAYGVLFGVANLFVLISLKHLPVSAQYPIITGGVIVVSTILSFARRESLSKKSVAITALAFIGTVLLAF